MASQLIERELYNGKYHMVHNPNARGRAPRYKVNDTEKPKGVTTILGQTLFKDLMQWAADSACLYLKEKLPVITEDDLKMAAKAYTVKRDAGASTGTEAHAMVEEFLKTGKVTDKDDYSIEAHNAYEAFVEWYASVEPEMVNVEEVIYSEKFKYAGTYDCMLRLGERTYLCDLKTTNPSKKAPNGVYAENFIQLGAYALAHEEQRAYEEANGGTELTAIDGLMVISAKKNGKLDIITNDDLGLSLQECSEMFKKVINVYNFMSYTSSKLGGK